MKNKKDFTLRVLLYALGGILLSVGVAFALEASWVGAGAYDVLAETVKKILGFEEITLAYYILGTIAYTLGLLLTRNKVYLLSFIPFITLSPVVDVALVFIPDASTWAMQIFYFLLGIELIAIGVSFMILVKSPISPLDVVTEGIRINLKLKTFGPAKIITDATLIVITFCLSYFILGYTDIGVGTFLYCIILGPVIDVNTRFCRPMINKIVHIK